MAGTDTEKLSELMRTEWNRRIEHDYRFWMSDGYASDEAMWASGERDLGIIARDIADADQKTVLEIGCGVGRLLHAAIPQFKRVVGVDVSTTALQKAKELLGTHQNLELVTGSGVDLDGIDSESIDLVISFAALTSVPTDIFAGYLREIHRVLSDEGRVRLQVYLGREQSVGRDDTLHLRCYDPENFKSAMALAAFDIEWIEELVLPFQVSFEEAGIGAMVVSLRKQSDVPGSRSEIAEALLPGGEGDQTDDITGLEVEYWMALNYAKELLEQGDIERAKKSVEYATTYCQTSSIDVQDLLERIVQEIEKREQLAQSGPSPTVLPSAADRSDLLEKNLSILKDRFSELFQRFSTWEGSTLESIEIRKSADGTVFFCDGQCLDHPEKPVAAGKNWAERLLAEPRIREAECIVVYGLGSGYHLEELLKLTDKTIAVIEPSEELFFQLLKARDCEKWLTRCTYLSIGKQADRPSFLDGETELAVRPQTQTISQEYTLKLKSWFYGARGLAKLHPAMTVLGPIQGGTLPILEYCTRGLASLNQRVRSIDMSCFAKGFSGIDDLLHDDIRQRVARGKYTEMLSEVILEMAAEKPMDILICMAQAPITGAALTELRKQGVITVLWFVEDYLRFPVWKYMAPFYDFIFTIQRGDCIKAIKAAGAGEVHYLPTGCDPIVHRPLELTDEEKKRWGSPISFVGAGYHNRQQMFASLSDLPFHIWGTEWPGCKPFDRMVQEEGRRLKPEEYIKIFNGTDINLNLHSSMERDGVDPYGDFLNPRTFELAACGAFQLVDPRSLLPEVFEVGKEVITFADRTELIEKIEYYRNHPEERAAVTTAARNRVLREHTYGHRMQEMLSHIYSSKFEQLLRREEKSPWKRMIDRARPHGELKDRCEKAFNGGEEPNLDGLVADIVSGEGKLSETEQKLMFLFHVRKQMIKMRREETGKL